MADSVEADKVGEYQVKATLKTYEGKDFPVAKSTSFDDLKMSVTCFADDVQLVTKPSEYDEIPTYYSRSKAHRIPLPTYSHFPAACDATIKYTLEQVNGDPVPSYIKIVGD